MNFHQLRAAREAVRRGFNLTGVAAALDSSQPVVSRQVRGLEDELGVDLFVRAGKRLVGMTEVGKSLMPYIELVLENLDSVRHIAREWRTPHEGRLSLAATHAHARYLLPQVLQDFRVRYPQVDIHLRQGSAGEIADMLLNDEVDVGIAADSLGSHAQLVTLPCYRHTAMILAPHGHALLKIDRPLALRDLVKYPLITYESGARGRSQLDEAFARAGLTPNVVLGAITADVIKTYVEVGMGVGVATSIAWDEARDSPHLRMLDAGHLFPISTTLVGWRRGHRLSGLARAFIETLSPTLTAESVKEAAAVA